MTKSVRIENADTSDHKVRVEVYEKDSDGQMVVVHKQDLLYPTQMATVTIHSDRWIHVSEIPAINNEVGPGMP